MFKKVLVAEDMDSINHAVASVLNELNIPTLNTISGLERIILDLLQIKTDNSTQI